MYRMRQLVFIVAKTPSCQRVVVPFQRVQAKFSSNITYSGGQAAEGQGGFYGSGGARAETADQAPTIEESRQSMLALAADVQKISLVMKELDTLENLLDRETDATTGRAIEIKASIKKLMTQPEILESLNRLEIHGKPIWGLSSDERELIVLAREKVNEC